MRDSFVEAHARLDRSLDAFRALARKDSHAARILFADFRRSLEHHMRCEEEVLFAAIEQRLGSRSGPTAVMHSEHRRILDALARLSERIDAGDSSCDEDEAALIELLRTHNVKEERILYPMIDRLMTADERRRLLGGLSSVAIEGSPRCCA